MYNLTSTRVDVEQLNNLSAGLQLLDSINFNNEAEVEFNFDITCMDLDFGDCPKLENTPCHNCIQNDLVGFTWNKEIPDDYNTL